MNIYIEIFNIFISEENTLYVRKSREIDSKKIKTFSKVLHFVLNI